MKLRSLLAAALLAATALVPAGPAYPGMAETALQAERLAHPLDFTLPDMAGNPVSLDRFVGKTPVFLLFWATWCPHCDEAVPRINAIHEASRPGNRLAILALDYKESPETVAEFIRKHGVSYPVLLDREGTVAHRYQVLGLPTYILLDASGRIVYRGYELPEISRFLGPFPAR